MKWARMYLVKRIKNQTAKHFNVLMFTSEITWQRSSKNELLWNKKRYKASYKWAGW